MASKKTNAVGTIAPDFDELMGMKKPEPVNAVLINNVSLPVKEYNGVRVVTFKDIDTLHRRPEGTARKRFNDNKQHFIEGEDFFKVKCEEVRPFFGQPLPNGFNPNADVVLITESGYFMITKSLKDDLAWQIHRQLVNVYFRAKKAQTALQNLSPQLQAMINLEVRQNNLESRMSDLERRVEDMTAPEPEPEPERLPFTPEPKKWSEREKEYLRRAYALGQTDVEIAADMGRTVDSIKNKRRALGLHDDSKSNRRWRPDEDKKLIKYYNQGVTFYDIGQLINRSADGVQNRLHRLRKVGKI